MADIRLKKISVDSSPLIIQNGNINITNTDESQSILTGALISNGGISIKCTSEATSSSSGGALTVGGGVSTMSDLYIGKGLILESLNSTIKVNGVSENRLFLDNIINKQFYISLDGVYKTFELNEQGVYINNNTPSEDFSTGALRVLGGVTINSTEESTSISSGSGLTVFGGAGIVKKLFIGGGIESIDSSNTIGNLYTLTNGNIGIGTTDPLTLLSITPLDNGAKITLRDTESNNSHYGFGVSDNQLNYDVNSYTDDHVFYANSKNGNGVELVRIKGTGKVNMNGDLSTLGYINPSLGKNQNGIIFIGDTIDDNAWIKYYEADINIYNLEIGISNNNSSNNIVIVGPGNVGINTTNPSYKLDINGTVNAITYTGGNMQLSGTVSAGNIRGSTFGATTYTGGNMMLSGSITSANMITQNVVTSELKSGSSTLQQNKIEVKGEENVDRYIRFRKSTLGNSGIIFSEEDSFSFYQCMHGGFLSISGTNGNPVNVGERGDNFLTINTQGNVGIGINNTTHKFYVNGSIMASGNVTFGSFFVVSNKIGINNTDPTNGLDINIDTRITNSLIIDTMSTTGALLVKNGSVSILCTEESINYTTGALTISGGTSINKNLYVKENTNINGILKIENSTNSTTSSNGSVQVLGGVGVVKDVTIGGTLSSDKILVINEEGSLNYTTGAIICNGGITIVTEENATSSTCGGGLTVAGGIGIAKDIYIEGNSINKGLTNYYSEANSFIQIYNSGDEKIYSLDRDYYDNTFSLSRYNAGSLIEKTFELSLSDGIFKFNNTANSISKSVASVIITGGLSINSTENSVNSTYGGALSIYGGQSIAKNLNIGGTLIIRNTEECYNSSTGSVMVYGGVAIHKNLNVTGNTTINGNLYVNGSTTTIESSNTVLNDNILVLNAAPSGISDSGIIITRYQEDNDIGFGDIVNETSYVDFQIPLQSGMSNVQIKLSGSASSINDYYKNWWIKITSGFCANQVRKIMAYDGNTKIATVSSAWTTQNPGENEIVFLYNRAYVGLIYNETDDIFEFGSTLEDPGKTSIVFTDNIKLKAGEIIISGTKGSENSSTGSLVLSGGISINCTRNASGNTDGGSLTINGGGSIRKDLYIGEELYVNNINFTPNLGDKIKSSIFSANNNQSTPQTITGIDLDENIWGFDLFLVARLNAGSDLYSNYHIRGINKIDTWEIVKTYVGDDMGLEFYITNDGIVKYTSPDYANFITLDFKWRLFAN